MATKSLLLTLIFLISLAILLTGCGSQTASISPVEEQQIKSMVTTYITRDTNIPEYEVNIEKVDHNWARVSVSPVGTAEQPTHLYLHKQIEGTLVPTVATTVQPGHTSRVETTTGWAIVLGPQADFTKAELDQVGVPESVRL